VTGKQGQTPFFLACAAALLASCAGGPPPPDWQANAHGALASFQAFYLKGDTRTAEAEFRRAVDELSRAGSPALVARAELVRCAARTASLEFDDCPGFEKLRVDAGAEELAYAEYLLGRGERAVADDPLSKLVLLGIQMRTSKATPESISAALQIASAQGWRRPLLAWLGVEEKRAEAAGDREALERIRRRIALVSGKT
jgi:hypothetical protein